MDFHGNFVVLFFNLIRDSAFVEDSVESVTDTVISDDSSEVVGDTNVWPHLATEEMNECVDE